MYNIFVAYCKNAGIGYKNELPWKISKDLIKFQKLTTGNGNNAVIMGKNTFLSNKFLKNRDNLVLSTSLQLDKKYNNHILKSFHDIELLLQFIQSKNYNKVWIIGGESIYKLFLQKEKVDYIYNTYIEEEFKCDAFMAKIPNNFLLYHSINILDKTKNNNNILNMIYKKIKKGDVLLYKGDKKCEIMGVHYDDMPNLYFTIKIDDNEKQTNLSNLTYI